MSINQLGDKTTGHSLGLAYLSDLNNNPLSVCVDNKFSLTQATQLLISETIVITKPSYIVAIANANIRMNSTLQVTSAPSDFQIILAGELSTRTTESQFAFINSTASASSTQNIGLVLSYPYPAGSHTFTLTINILFGTIGSFEAWDRDLTLIPIAYNVGV